MDALFALNLSVNHIVQVGGLVLIGFVLFAEVGLFLGFFLPGDTLLIAGGIYAKQGKLNLAGLMVVAAIAAIAGDSLAYWIGRFAGKKLLQSDDSVLFDKRHVARAEAFYERYGPKTLLIAHFIAVVRTISPVVAGIAELPYKTFLKFDAVGDTAWAVTVSLLGYYVGSRIPNIDHYILAAIGLVIIASLAPTVYHLGRRFWRKRHAPKS